MSDTPMHAVPDPDDPSADPSAEPSTAPEDLGWVTAALADLDYLRGPGSPAGAADLAAEPMPEAVWQQLRTGLSAAVGERSATTAATQVPLTQADVPRRAARSARWLGGVAAAGVVIIAVGVATVALRGGGPAVVAGDAGTQAKLAAPSAATLSADQAAPAAAEAAPSADAPQSTGLGPLEPEPAARVVMDSRTAYEPTTLRSQVTSMVKGAGFATVREAMTKQSPRSTLPAEGGFTSSWARLRDCITRLTSSDQAQALVVDRGTYAGADAGVVVAPVDFRLTASDEAAPPTAVVSTPVGTFDIWVVDPECDQVAASIDDFPLYAWQP